MPKRLLDSDESDNNSGDHQDEMSVPFPLADLPYDLLEETAAYFTQHEAVKVLTVNKNFNIAFTRSVWRCLKSRGKAVRLPAAMWEKYGHLVRTAYFACPEEMKDIAARMPNVKYLALHFGYSMRYFLSMELPRLCSLKLRFDGQCSWSKEMVLKLIHWIQDIDKRGQRLDVHWDIKCSRPRHYSVLDCILEAFGDSTGHTFTLRVGVDEPEPIARFPQLLQKLTKLEIKHAYDNFFFFQQYAAFFGDDDITYPRLHTLVLSQKGNRDEPRRYRIINIIPDHFPSLRHLVLGFEDHHGFVNMEPTFKHDWESVTELSVVMFDIGYDMRCLLDGFSNVTKLSISEVFCVLNLYTIAEQMPQLQYLILHQIYDKIVVSPEEFYEFYEYDYDHDDPESWPESPTSWPVLSNLKELSIIKATEKIMLEVLLFILHSTPNLCSLELIHCYFSAEAFGKCTSQTLESMRSLVISCTKYGYGDAQLTKFMPNLRRMRLLYGYENERAQMQSQYPRIKIETVEYRDFHDDDD